MTPEPRLFDARSRGPKNSSSPKKYRKNGSTFCGLREVICSEEMLATPFTAAPATRVKSGAAAAATDAAGAACCDAAGLAAGARQDWAAESPAVRIRPVTTRPAAKPPAMRTVERRNLRTMLVLNRG